MDKLLDLPRLLPLADWLGMAVFFGAWVGYAVFARRRSRTRPSFLGSSNRVRRQWMLQTTYREVRVLDGVVVQQLSSTASFFASTTILIIGALLAVLGATEQASDLVREIPVRGADLAAGLRLQGGAAGGHLRLCLLPLHLVHPPVQRGRAAGGRRARGCGRHRRRAAPGLR